MEEKLMSKKKPIFPINEKLSDYLTTYNRNSKISIFYNDLLRFSASVKVLNENGEDTLWVRAHYDEYERDEIELSLKKVYTILHSDGNEETIKYLTIDEIDYCTFGNSKPFRIKVRNILNDNYTYLYVKRADASRVYGLELEHIVSPNRINFWFIKKPLSKNISQVFRAMILLNIISRHLQKEQNHRLPRSLSNSMNAV